MAKFQFDDSKSLEQLENDYWVDFEFPSKLVEKCHHYRKVPIKDLSIEQLRLLIGQDIGLSHLIPVAISLLKVDILCEGDLYAGDLLSSVLTTEQDYWKNNSQTKKAFTELIESKRKEIEVKNESNTFRQLLKKIDAFLDN